MWSNGIGSRSYHLYKTIAVYELYVCELESGADEAKWKKLTPIQAFPSRHNLYEITGLKRGIEYYFAVRSMDVHERRWPFDFICIRREKRTCAPKTRHKKLRFCSNTSTSRNPDWRIKQLNYHYDQYNISPCIKGVNGIFSDEKMLKEFRDQLHKFISKFNTQNNKFLIQNSKPSRYRQTQQYKHKLAKEQL